MLEATCTKCKETFVPADETDTLHLETEQGTPCGGQGVITREYIRPRHIRRP